MFLLCLLVVMLLNRTFSFEVWRRNKMLDSSFINHAQDSTSVFFRFDPSLYFLSIMETWAWVDFYKKHCSHNAQIVPLEWEPLQHLLLALRFDMTQLPLTAWLTGKQDIPGSLGKFDTLAWDHPYFLLASDVLECLIVFVCLVDN